jgi:hypothetical protein
MKKKRNGTAAGAYCLLVFRNQIEQLAEITQANITIPHQYVLPQIQPMQLDAWFLAIPSWTFCQTVENKRKIKLQAQYLAVTV